MSGGAPSCPRQRCPKRRRRSPRAPASLRRRSKRARRVAAEGVVGVATGGLAGAVVEVNSETDFVARNELFQAFVRTVAGLAVAGNGDVEALKEMPYPGTGRTVAEELTELVGRIGENL